MITTDVALAAQQLNSCRVVAIPTETVYGLAALVSCPDAIQRVYTIKNRPTDHPLIVHLSPNASPEDWGIFNQHARTLAATCWPGPLTLLVPRTSRVPNSVTGGRESVAIRVPAHRVTQNLLNQLNDAIVAPSANTFGHVSPTNAQHVADDLGVNVDLILDGGSCDVGIESTIVDCTVDPPQIVRPGAITAQQIETLLSIDLDEVQGPSRAPGMLASHYAPTVPIILTQSIKDAEQLVSNFSATKHRYKLINFDDLTVYAARLYKELRDAEDTCDGIVAVLPPAEGLGVAICDRLTKAAAPK